MTQEIKAEGVTVKIEQPQDITVTDKNGVVITLKKPSALQRLDFKKAIGEDAIMSDGRLNPLVVSELAHLQYVHKIDGVIVPIPADKGELRALYQRMGDEGNEAAQIGVFEHFVNKQAAQEVELKNS